jgi:hypothetical protein
MSSMGKRYRYLKMNMLQNMANWMKRQTQKEGVKHAGIIKRFKESFKEKHEDKKCNLDTADNVLKHMDESIRQYVTRRRDKASLVERVTRRYNKDDSDDPFRLKMSSYFYGLVFLVLTNVCIVQVCLQIAKQDKGRRHE